MDKILIAYEKHGNHYFDASTNELRDKSALYLLTERFNDGYWYYKPEKPDGKNYLTEKQIAALPTQSLREQETKKLIEYQKYLREYDRELEDYNQIKNCVKSKDSNLAWKLLLSRSGEYERVEIESLDSRIIRRIFKDN